MSDAANTTSVDGGDGSDALEFVSDISGVGVTVTYTDNSTGIFSFDGTPGTGSFTGIEVTFDSAFNDLIDASTTDIGQNLQGNFGEDTLIGGSGNDVAGGGLGNDQIFGGAGNDVLADAGGDDSIFGGLGNDIIASGSGDDFYFGGEGDDTLFGGSGSDTFEGGEGADIYNLSSGGGSDSVTDFAFGEDMFDSSRLQDLAGGEVTADEVIVVDNANGTQTLFFPDGEDVTISGGTIDTTTPGTQFNALVAAGIPPCFVPGTLIATPDGETPVEDLRVGDLVLKQDHGPQPLRWIGWREVDFTDPTNTRADRDKPILIGEGSLGGGLPKRDLIVSPQHRMLLSGEAVRATCGSDEALGLAKGLTERKGVREMRGKRHVTDIALLLDRHEIIFAEGAPTESFRPGPVAMEGFDKKTRAQVYAIYPGILRDPRQGLGPTARPVFSKRQVEAVAVAPASTTGVSLEITTTS